MTVTLTYFDVPGRALPTRLCLLLSGTEFEDNRISFEEFATLKPNTPMGQVPLLTVDGVVHAQSGAMLRYYGAKSGLYPVNNLEEMFLVDEAVHILEDLLNGFRSSADKDAWNASGAGAKIIARFDDVLSRLPEGKITIAHLAAYSFAATAFLRDDAPVWKFFDKGLFPSSKAVQAASRFIQNEEKFRAYFEKHPQELFKF